MLHDKFKKLLALLSFTARHIEDFGSSATHFPQKAPIAVPDYLFPFYQILVSDKQSKIIKGMRSTLISYAGIIK